MGRALGQALVGGVRLAKRIIAVDAHECVDAAIDGVDAVETRLHGLTGGDFPGREPGRQLV